LDVSSRSCDAWRPPGILPWRTYFLNGLEQALPPGAKVTSKAPKKAHYALIRWSDEPLALRDLGPFDQSLSSLRRPSLIAWNAISSVMSFVTLAGGSSSSALCCQRLARVAVHQDR
jgi:hypothetical protein